MSIIEELTKTSSSPAQQKRPFGVFISNDVVAENTPRGTLVGTLSSDIPEKGPIEYELIEPSSVFELVGAELRTGCNPAYPMFCLNYERQRSYVVLVRGTGANHSAEAKLIISITDVDEGPRVNIVTSATIDEHAVPFTPVGTIELFDYEAEGAESIRHQVRPISWNLPQAFGIDGNTIETRRFGELSRVPRSTITLRVVTSAIQEIEGFPFNVAIAVKDVTIPIVRSTAPEANGVNPIRFVIDTDLQAVHSEQWIEQRLHEYVDDLNSIYSKNTQRRFTFDSTTGIDYIDGDRPYTTSGPCFRSPDYAFTVYLITQSPFQQTGGAGCGRRGENEMQAVVYFMGRMCPRVGTCERPTGTFAPLYRQVVFLIAHEIGHNNGLGDTYLTVSIPDHTGLEPDNSLRPLYQDPNNSYWLARPDTFGDPMGHGGPIIDSLDDYRFSSTHAKVIDEYALAQIGDPRLDTSGIDNRVITPQDIPVQLVDDDSAQPIKGCTVRLIGQYRAQPDQYSTETLDSAVSNSDGVATVTLSGRLHMGDVVFIKASCDSYQPVGSVATLPDFLATQKFPQTRGVVGGFNTRVVLRASR